MPQMSYDEKFRTIVLEGNAARKLNPQPVPEYETTRDERPEQQEEPFKRVRSKVELRPQGKISVTAVAGFAMAAMLAVGVLTSHIQLTGIYADTVAAQRQLSALQEENAKLEAEYEAIFDTETLQAAASRAGLQEPEAGQKVYMELADPDNAVVYHNEGDEVGLKGCVHAVKSFFTGIGAYFS